MVGIARLEPLELLGDVVRGRGRSRRHLRSYAAGVTPTAQRFQIVITLCFALKILILKYDFQDLLDVAESLVKCCRIWLKLAELEALRSFSASKRIGAAVDSSSACN